MSSRLNFKIIILYWCGQINTVTLHLYYHAMNNELCISKTNGLLQELASMLTERNISISQEYSGRRVREGLLMRKVWLMLNMHAIVWNVLFLVIEPCEDQEIKLGPLDNKHFVLFTNFSDITDYICIRVVEWEVWQKNK